jgi:hypothetical protein
MEKSFQCIIVDKNDPMDHLMDALKALGLPLENRAIALGPNIILPYVPGVPRKHWTLKRQVEVMTHECIHRQRDIGDMFWLLKYAVNRRFRAHEEAKAYHADLEMGYFFTGRRPKIDCSDMGKFYRLNKSDVRYMDKHLDIVRKNMFRGKGSDKVIRFAMDWWEGK